MDFEQQIEALGNQIVHFFNPELAKSGAAEPPTRSWPAVRFSTALGIAVGYILFVVIGSAIMKRRREPVKLFNQLKYLYNPVQVIVCAWMSIEAGRQAYNLNNAKLLGNTFDPSRTAVANVLWVFYVSKILDFLDTVFIVFGQKWKQLTFLHVYHHVSIFLTYWMITCAGSDGDIYLTIVLNAFVHTCMYLYYMITSLNLYAPVLDYAAATLSTNGQKIDDSAPGTDERVRVRAAVRYNPKWKHWITKLQMGQFILMNAQAIYLIYFGGEYPVRITWYYLFYIQSLFWLFFDFSRKAYGKKKKRN